MATEADYLVDEMDLEVVSFFIGMHLILDVVVGNGMKSKMGKKLKSFLSVMTKILNINK